MAATLLTTSQLSQLRTLSEAGMPNTATILRRTLTDDGNGGQVESYASVGTVSCRVRADNSRTNKAEGGRITNPDYWILNVSVSAEIEETDRFTIDSMPGQTFEAVGPLGATSHQLSQFIRLRRL